MSLRVAFLGAGFIARIHRDLLAGSGTGHRITAVFDPDAERARRFAAACDAVVAESAAEAIEAADAVYVCTWTSEHPRLVTEVARAGRAVFCEKPLGIDLPTARAMTEVVERAGVVNQVGLILRSLPTFRYLRHLLDHPDNGRVMSVVFRDDQCLPIGGEYGSDWRADASRSGAGTLLEHSIHDLDILEWLLGPVTAMNARMSSFHGYPGIDDTAVVSLAFEEGVLGTLTSVWHDVTSRPSLRRLEVFCEAAYYALEGDLAGPLRWERADGDAGSLEGAELSSAADAVGAGWDNPADRFLRAAAEGSPCWPDFRSALRAHALTDAAYESARLGGAVRKPPPVIL